MRAGNPMRRSWLDDTDGGWIAHRLVLLVSPAWQARPKPLAGILERLEIEHMRHAGLENGNLIVSYDQFVAFGVSRKIIRAAEVCGRALGLIEAVHSEESIGGVRAPNRYRLTYVPEKGKRAPTDEWQGVTAERAAQVVADFQNVATKKRGPSYPRGTHAVPLGYLPDPVSSSPFGQTPVTHGEPPLISTHQPDEARPSVVAPPHVGRVSEAGQAVGPIPISAAFAGILAKSARSVPR
jgi:hypothetical protein